MYKNFFNQGRIYKILPFFLLIVAISITSCKKNQETVGFDVLPSSDNLQLLISDTFNVNAYTVKEDSTMPTDETTLNLLGSYYDPIFGKFTASIYTQFLLSSSNVSFGTNAAVDSVVLSLAYNGYYGDISSEQTVNVYELSESLYLDSIYQAYKNIPYKTNLIGSSTFKPNPTDSIIIDSKKITPQLRIRLSNNFAQQLFAASANDLSSSSTFLNFFKGIYITALPINNIGSGAILYFNLLNSATKLNIYYSNSEGTGKSFPLIINEYAARFNNFNHYGFQYAQSDLKNQILNNDTAAGKQQLYIQAMAGVKTKLRFPNLVKLANSSASNSKPAIQQAKLIICVNDMDASQSTFALPPKLTLSRINSKGENEFLIDQFEGSNYFGGNYDATKKEYQFNITRYIQWVTSGIITDYGLNVVVSGSAVKANRAVINGPNKTSNPLRLQITYTKF